MEELDQCQQLGVQLLSNQFCPHLRLHPWGKARFDLFLWYVKVLPKHINTMYVWSLLNCHNSIRDQSIWKILMVTNSNISLVSSLPVSILSSFWQTLAKRTQCCLLFKILQKQVNNSAKLSCLPVFNKFQIIFIIKSQTLWEYKVESKFCPNGTLYNIIEIKGFCFQNQAPPWWKQPLMGPAFPTGHKPAPKEMRKPGCNGGVCYCNKENYCNDRHNVSRNSTENHNLNWTTSLDHEHQTRMSHRTTSPQMGCKMSEAKRQQSDWRKGKI